MKCVIYNIVFSYYSLITNTGILIQNVIFWFLHRARIDNNSSGRISNNNFARNCIAYYFLSATTHIDESDQKTAFRHPVVPKQGHVHITNIHWFDSNRGRQFVHNIACQRRRVILRSVRRIIKHLKQKCSIHVIHTFENIQIHFLYNS